MSSVTDGAQHDSEERMEVRGNIATPPRVFVGNRMTREWEQTCASLGINSNLINASLIDAINEEKSQHEDLDEFPLIRRVYQALKDKSYIKSNLAMIFKKTLSHLSHILHNSRRGANRVGRLRSLTIVQENEVVEYIRNCQRAGRCATFTQVTKWVNEELLYGSQVKISCK